MDKEPGSTLFIKKTNPELKIGSLPTLDLYNTKYIFKEGKLLSPHQLNDLASLHRTTGLSWENLIEMYIK
jgi:hypothetical protein